MYLIIINLMRKHLRVSFLQSSFSFFYKLILSLVLFSIISACGNNSDSAPTSKSSLAIPAQLQKLAANDNELNAYVVIDGDENNRIPMILNRDGQGLASVVIPDLSREAHSLVITYEFTNVNGTIILATSNQVVNLTSGSDSITVGADEYDLNIHDEDSDGVNNAQELLLGRDPFIPEADMVISTAIPAFSTTATGTLRALVVLDGDIENPIEMDIDVITSTASFTFDALLKTPHDIVVTFEYTDNTGKLILANAIRNVDLTNTSGSVEIDIDVNNDDFAVLDDDGDGVSNAVELIAGLNPRISQAPAAPAIPTLTYEPTKVFRFTWQDVPDATYYQLQERVNTGGKLNVISDKILFGTQTFKHIVPLYARLNAEYVLRSCNAVGCIDSGFITVQPTLFFNSVGSLNVNIIDPVNLLDPLLDISVSLSGDGKTLVIGTGAEDAASIVAIVFVFVNNKWEQQSAISLNNIEIFSPENRSNNIPKVTLSNDGNTLILSSPGDDSGFSGVPSDMSMVDSGAVYVYIRDGNNWIQQAYLKASNIGAGDQFGSVVGLSADGNTLVVGSPFEDSDAIGVNGNQNNDLSLDSGVVYIFNRNGANWVQQSYIKASNTDIGDQFGFKVTLSGDGKTFAAGVPSEDGIANTLLESGAVYVFALDNFNSWDEQQILKLTTAEANEGFGGLVDLSFNGNTLVAHGGADNGVYIFNRNENQIWSQNNFILIFGVGTISLDNSGSTFMIGKPLDFGGGIGDFGGERTRANGSFESFMFNGSDWIQQARITSERQASGNIMDLSGNGQTFVAGGNSGSILEFY